MDEHERSLTDKFLKKYGGDEDMMEREQGLVTDLDAAFDMAVARLGEHATALRAQRNSMHHLFKTTKTNVNSAARMQKYDKVVFDNMLVTAIEFGVVMGSVENDARIKLEADILDLLENANVTQEMQIKAARFGGEWFAAKCAKKRAKLLDTVKMVPEAEQDNVAVRIEDLCGRTSWFKCVIS